MQHMPNYISNETGRSGPGSTVDLLELFWRRRTYVIACTLLGIVLGLIYGVLATPMYESTADVLVVQKRPQAVTGDNQYESGFEDYLATHLAIIVSPVIVERAIEESDLASLESFADLENPEEDLVDTIIDNLEVERWLPRSWRKCRQHHDGCVFQQRSRGRTDRGSGTAG